MKDDERDEEKDEDQNLDFFDDDEGKLMKQDPMLSSPNFPNFSSSSSSASSRKMYFHKKKRKGAAC